MNTLALPEARDTEHLGAALAASMPAHASVPLIVHLRGELGSGKTTLVRGLLQSLGVTGYVRSPTFTLLECYETAGQRIVHMDLYRITNAEDMAALGLRDELVAGVLVVIEWPERGACAVPPADLTVTLVFAEDGRRACIQAGSAAGTLWAQALRVPPRQEFNRV